MKSIVMGGVLMFMFLVAVTETNQQAQNSEPEFNRERLLGLMAHAYTSPPEMSFFRTSRPDWPEGSFRMVFVHDERRYILEHIAPLNNGGVGGLVHIWIRRDRTSGNIRNYVLDLQADGVVDQGNDTISSSARQFRRNQKIGSEFEPHWQRVYDDALVALSGLFYTRV